MPDKIDKKAFDSMLQSAEPDKTIATFFKQEKKDTTKDLHNTLMLAGFAPAYGNIADAADALLYAAEGEFGEAALSGASAIPIIGQFVAGKRALKTAKEAGEEMVTLYRTAEKWYPKKMVRDGKFVGANNKTIFTSPNKSHIETMRKGLKLEGSSPPMLEFEVPRSWLNKNNKNFYEHRNISKHKEFETEGIPKEFLKKVHK